MGYLKSPLLSFVNSLVFLRGKIKILNHKGFTKTTLSFAKEKKVIFLF